MDDDPALIGSALAGDEAAFEELIRRFSRRLYAVAFGVVQNASEAEEIVQDVLLRAWRDRRKIRPPERLPGWLILSAKNRAVDALRRRRSEPLPDGSHFIPDESIPAAGAAIDAAVRSAAVRRALSDLPDHYRVALSLRYLEGMDCRSIESSMGLSPGALRGILARALEALRRVLKPQLQEG